MSKKNDQVFPTSLSEIAFILVFLIMILLGYMILKEQKEKEKAHEQLAKVAVVQSAEAATQAMREANRQLREALTAGGHQKPQEMITQLVEAKQVRTERDELREQLRELDEKLTALTALREQLAKAGSSKEAKITKDEVESAMALQDQVRKLTQNQVLAQSNPKDAKDQKNMADQAPPLDNKQVAERVKQAIATTNELHSQVKEKLDHNIKRGDEPGVVRDLVKTAKNFEDFNGNKKSYEMIKTENADLRGQLLYASRQLNAKGGLDHAPCWADEQGKIEFLFNVETRPGGFVVSKGWLPHREQAARALPGIDQAISDSNVSPTTFASNMQPILNWSKKQDPECRHFVHLATTISDADARDSARKQVEGFFYKLEVKH